MCAERKEIVEIDVSRVNTPDELHQALKDGLDFPYFYGMNWSAFWDAIRGLVDLPKIMVLKGWINVEEKMPEDAGIMKELMEEFNQKYPGWDSEVRYE